MKTLLAALAMSVMMATTPTFAEEMKIPRTISISGHGEMRVAPDIATISMGVFTSADTAAQAVAENTKAMQNLFAKLKQAGIAERDMQTSNFSVNPRIVYPQDGSATPPKVSGYDVSNQVAVVIRKLDSVGAVLDQVVAAGSNQINGISFGVTDDTAATDDARKNAVKDARRKAELYAIAAGVSLGQITSIGEAGIAAPQPVMYARAKLESAAADVPIAQGEQVISADVAIVWEIK